jgi:two-component system sensor histidine kinase KdpD
MLADAQGHLAAVDCQCHGPANCQLPSDCIDFTTARDVLAHGERRIADAIYLPLQSGGTMLGVMVVRPAAPAGHPLRDHLSLMEGFAAQLALALQRVHFAVAAEQARFSAERVLLRNTLLSSISHDLRAPLAAIAGAGGLIAQPECALNPARLVMLGKLIERKAEDMSRLLANVLEIVRMELGDKALQTDWHDIEDLVAHTLRSNEARLCAYRVKVDLPVKLPLIMVEATLIVQILSNLLENAVKYTPPGTCIGISAAVSLPHVVLVVTDDGPGLPDGDPERLFEKFERGKTATGKAGVGLGLAICRAAARLHGGEILAMGNPGGGARFEITLPVQQHHEAPMSREIDRVEAYA